MALKVPHMEGFSSEPAIEFFVEEARKAAQLEHPGIVRILDVQRDTDSVFIVQQYVDGGDLRVLLQKNRLSYRQVAKLMIAIADAIGFSHQRRWWHLDFKPANILLDSAGRPYVADSNNATRRGRCSVHSPTCPPSRHEGRCID